ncbi:hypothetical protein VTN02DRAFT_4612 [Thermoascus thermophilus]
MSQTRAGLWILRRSTLSQNYQPRGLVPIGTSHPDFLAEPGAHLRRASRLNANSQLNAKFCQKPNFN